MRQLVGLPCVVCGKGVDSIVEGRFCESCGCPVHTACAHPAESESPTGGDRCPACGARPEDVTREQGLHKQDERQQKVDATRRQRFAYMAGLVGCSLMTLQGAVSTLRREPDGRVLNTAPALGVDIFLFVGLLGAAYFLFKLTRLR